MRGKFASLFAWALGIVLSFSALAQTTPIFFGPSYDPSTQTGYSQSFIRAGTSLNDLGTAVIGENHMQSGQAVGVDTFRWDLAGGGSFVQLTNPYNVGTFPSAQAFAINDVNVAVGYAAFNTATQSFGDRPIRWDADGSVTQLDVTSFPNTFVSRAEDVNHAGLAVGFAQNSSGRHPVLWRANGSAVDLSPSFGPADPAGVSQGTRINDTGVIAGQVIKVVSGTSKGLRAVRWSADPTPVALELDMTPFGADSNGMGYSQASSINGAGVVVGLAKKYVGGVYKGDRAVRWAADATGTATELSLGTFGANSSGQSNSGATDINDSGVVVGQIEKYQSGNDLGSRAVRWDANGNLLELANLGVSSSGSTTTSVNDINNSGKIVGRAATVSGGVIGNNHAVMWDASDGSIVDLNTLIDPSLHAELIEAFSISNTGFVTGIANFDPDGSGPQQPYQRAFGMQISPEPSTASVVLACVACLMRRRRNSRGIRHIAK